MNIRPFYIDQILTMAQQVECASIVNPEELLSTTLQLLNYREFIDRINSHEQNNDLLVMFYDEFDLWDNFYDDVCKLCELANIDVEGDWQEPFQRQYGFFPENPEDGEEEE